MLLSTAEVAETEVVLVADLNKELPGDDRVLDSLVLVDEEVSDVPSDFVRERGQTSGVLLVQ